MNDFQLSFEFEPDCDAIAAVKALIPGVAIMENPRTWPIGFFVVDAAGPLVRGMAKLYRIIGEGVNAPSAWRNAMARLRAEERRRAS